jgi:hypothetical protein
MSPTAVAAGPSSVLPLPALVAPLPFAPEGFVIAAISDAPYETVVSSDWGRRSDVPVSNTTRTEWTLTTSPTLARVSWMTPARGAAMVTVALSVMTSTIG